MHLSLSIKTSAILCRGISSISEQQEWGRNPLAISDVLPFGKLTHVPMMQARRMSKATGLACETFLSTSANHSIDAAVFLSEHGELERSHKVLDSINQNSHISPTDFSMSVHNVAAGLTTILSQKNIEVSSISAGKDGLLQALYEVLILLESGSKRVLLVAFDGAIPDFYLDYGVQPEPTYAASILFEKGSDWQIILTNSVNTTVKDHYPLPIQLMHSLLSNQKDFFVHGINQSSHWKCNV